MRHGPGDDSDAIETERRLDEVRSVFSKWFGDNYDLQALDAVLATAAAERLPGDPLWLLVIAGSGGAKTETVQSLAGAGAHVTSTITSEGALLSGSPAREIKKDTTGGLLRRIGDHGLLVIKDVTSILSMHRDTRSAVLAALREVHDGRWERNVGSNGGRTLTWTGRLVVVGATTTAWDQAHSVIASMGDRFVLIRMSTSDPTGRDSAGHHALSNTGRETAMRIELAESVARVIACVDPDQVFELTNDEADRLVTVANVVTLARTAVERDYRGDVIDAHAPEMPTRFTKQLLQLIRGALAIGVDRGSAVRLAIRAARDSMPPLRLAILEDIQQHPHSRTQDVRRRLDKPRATIDRELQSLHMLGLLVCEEEEAVHAGRPATVWRYRLVDDIDVGVLRLDEAEWN